MLNERHPIPVSEAVQRVMAYKKTGEIEYVALTDAHQRVLAEDLLADHDVPIFDRSPYDGYALQSASTKQAKEESPVVLEVIGHIGAGSVHNEAIASDQAVRIMTGAPIPRGADAVIMLEDTETFERNGKNYVSIKKQLQYHQNISFKGEDVEKGTSLVKKGTVINPGIIALLATFGYAKVPVARKPVIGVIATGSELLEVDQLLEPGKIRNSNAYMIISQIERAGAIPKYYGQLEDDLEQSVQKISKVIEEVDFFITTGGVSVGDFDLLPEIYQRLEGKVLFNKVAMRPGSVTTVTATDEILLFGLSGNPSACYVGFELFTKPVIDAFLAKEVVGMKQMQATLAVDFPKANPFDRFVRGVYEIEDGELIARPAGKDKSNMVHSLASANCLIQLTGGVAGYKQGDHVTIHLL
ncbi:molybdopterin molybdotransferase MoeA [Gracilibacillus sp. S3-1-1]|uniref:Molybdopterin molybdotransferase MoeA n=1 Tax=Gracilibacillus pellucidus TaxID=3095368 RepID=A0ACC6M1C3_9BACI|nr:gephyrin-like molybdotransferase Glp [Gracilibacillus sp. S3-1-1]MDX8044743.1 molybdopterin molybdotransferase MoeA [Gracilibacillus sp. S3-1-1]